MEHTILRREEKGTKTAGKGPLLKRLGRALIRYRYFYLMLIPGVAYILLFHYAPMFGLTIAFQDYKVSKGVLGSAFVGLDNFRYLFRSDMFRSALRNTFIVSGLKILFGFPMPILFALLMNELRAAWYKRTVQTILYMPHFLSWAIMFGLVFSFVTEMGPLNSLIRAFGGKTIFFMSDTRYFRAVLVVSDIWKEVGWNAIIYLAALAAVPQDMYEAATIDGASRFKCMTRISLPCILPTIMVMFLLRVGGILNAGFEQIFTMYNPSVFSVADIIDTYVYRIGIKETKFSVSAAAGMFKSVVACIMVFTANYLAQRAEQESLF